MSYDTLNEDETQRPKKGKLRGVPGGSGESADESGGRSTGIFTGFGGGRVQSGGGGKARGGGGGGRTQAVVKGRYVKAGKTRNIKASVRYYTTHENERGEGMERKAFTGDSDSLERKEVYERLEDADRHHAYHYRMSVSPGTDRDAEGVDFKDYTRRVMEEAERQQRGSVSWVAVEHAGETAHTERAHVHVVLSTNETFDEKDFERLREHATRSFDEARNNSRFLDRDATLREDIKQLAELSERQREAKWSRERDVPSAERTHQQVQRDEPNEGEERERSRSRGRKR